MADDRPVSVWISALPLRSAFEASAAQHLIELAGVLADQPQLQAVLAGPGDPPIELGPGLGWEPIRGPETEWQRLRFEQSWLPDAAASRGADLLLVPRDAVPLRSDVPLAALAALQEPGRRRSLMGRIRFAVGQAGGRGVPNLWLDDLPRGRPNGPRNVVLPPVVAGGFRPAPDGEKGSQPGRRELPDEYVLALGERLPDALMLIASWTWVEASLGDLYPLVLLLSQPEHEEPLRERAQELDVSDTVHVFPAASVEELPVLMRGASALLHSGRTSSGQELRWAMACGLPIAAMQSVEAASIVGDAAYLTEQGDTRALGAACLTLLVETDQVARPLRDKGLMRATRFHDRRSVSAWVDVLLEISASKP